MKRFTDCLVLFSEVEESCTTWSILSLSRISVSCMLYGEMLVPVCVDVFVFISTAQLPCESFVVLLGVYWIIISMVYGTL